MKKTMISMTWMALLLAGTSMPAWAGDQALFRDDFDGAGIGEQWEVVNPDPDNAIVEEGMLQIVTQVPEKKLFNAKNLLLYKGELPKEYEAEARIATTIVKEGSCSVQGVNSPFVGIILKQDDDNAILLAGGKTLSQCSEDHAVFFLRLKQGKWQPGFWVNLGNPQTDRVVQLKLNRKGRVFVGYVQRKNKQGKPYWQQVGLFPLIHAGKYRLGLIAARGSGNTHEQLDKVDWVEIRKLKK